MLWSFPAEWPLGRSPCHPKYRRPGILRTVKKSWAEEKLNKTLELPCKNCDMDSNGDSMSFHVVTNWQQFGPNLKPISMTIPCHLSRFYLFFMLEHDMDFGQVQVMEFSWHFLRNDGISIEFDAIFDQTPVKKTRENPRHIFYRDNQSGITLFNWKFNTGICVFI